MKISARGALVAKSRLEERVEVTGIEMMMNSFIRLIGLDLEQTKTALIESLQLFHAAINKIQEMDERLKRIEALLAEEPASACIEAERSEDRNAAA